MGETSEVVTANFSPNPKQDIALAATPAPMQEAGLSLDNRGSATVLLVGLCEGDYVPLLANRLHKYGFAVEGFCPDRHPLAFSSVIERRHSPGWNIQAALLKVLELRAPALVIACDDPARQVLTRIHALCMATQRLATARIIETSFGDPAHFQTLDEKSRVLAALNPAQVRMPKRLPIAGPADLDGAFKALSAPIVLKRDRTWGGQGVAICRSLEQAHQQLARLQRKLPFRAALRRAFWQREGAALVEHFAQSAPVIEAEQYIEGEPANCVAACWKGEVAAALSVSVLEMQPRPIGPSTLVQIIDDRDIARMVAGIARQFDLSGVCGFDFMLERGTGAAYFLELNARATPTSHVGRSPATDVARALAQRCGLVCNDPKDAIAQDPVSPVALFPAEWSRDPHSAHLRAASVPWDDAAVMAGFIIEHALRLCPNQGRIAALLDRLATRHLQQRLRSIERRNGPRA
jgi:hypothetical protein